MHRHVGLSSVNRASARCPLSFSSIPHGGARCEKYVGHMSGCDPIPIGSLDSRTEAFDYETWAADSGIFAPFSQVCNVTGQPAASLPVNVFDGELPAAVQLAGHLCHDHLVLQSSSLIEKALGWKDFRPPIWADFSRSQEH